MLVGQENVGKTSLGKCLLKSTTERKILKRFLPMAGGGASPAQPVLGATQVTNANLSTDGIDMTTWVPPVEDDIPISFTVWDFAGTQYTPILRNHFVNLTYIYNRTRSVLQYTPVFPVTKINLSCGVQHGHINTLLHCRRSTPKH